MLVWAFMGITWFMLIMHVVKETRILPARLIRLLVA
jgi:hypothetical protein